MKKLHQLVLGLAIVVASTCGTSLFADANVMKVGVLNTRRCLEESKASKQERGNLDKMKNQMETVLKDKEKAIQAIQSKLLDQDYLDSISDDAERDLKHKRKVLMDEGMELNKQFVETLENANMKIVSNLVEQITKISKEIAQDSNQPLDVILTNEACTYFNEKLDITDKVLAKLDSQFEAEQKDQAAKK